jgi:hypothetical protein
LSWSFVVWGVNRSALDPRNGAGVVGLTANLGAHFSVHSVLPTCGCSLSRTHVGTNRKKGGPSPGSWTFFPKTGRSATKPAIYGLFRRFYFWWGFFSGALYCCWRGFLLLATAGRKNPRHAPMPPLRYRDEPEVVPVPRKIRPTVEVPGTGVRKNLLGPGRPERREG